MRRFRQKLGVLVIGIFSVSISLTVNARADVYVTSLFSSHMVIQRDKPIRVWGTADPGEAVTVTLASLSAATAADGSGTWSVALSQLPGGGPYVLDIRGKNTLEFTDVLVGEVWVASGQSNMGFQLGDSKDADQEIASAEHPDIRMFTVANKTALSPAMAVSGDWRVCSPATAKSFSAVAYYFAKHLEQTLHVPIGIIHSSWGGSSGQAWIPSEDMVGEPELAQLRNKDLDTVARFAQDQADYLSKLRLWEGQYGVRDPSTEYLSMGWLIEDALRNSFYDAQNMLEARLIATDPPNRGLARHWERPETDVDDWPITNLPATAQALGARGGAVIWLRSSVEVPSTASDHAIVIKLNNFSERVMLFVNGKSVRFAGTSKEPAFLVPVGTFHTGSNTIAIRVFAHTKTSLSLGTRIFLNTTPEFNINGPWHYKFEVVWPPLDDAVQRELPLFPTPPYMQQVSTILYNAMIAPLQNVSMSGAIWYQGESNADNPALYRLILPQVIASWRWQWGTEFPFYIVQLPNYGSPTTSVEHSKWASLRAVQAEVAASTPNSAIAVTIDVGEGKNLHPKDKLDVGNRLALLALARVYHQKLVDQGPVYSSATPVKGAVRIRFTNIGGKIGDKGAHLTQFWIAGEDRKFVAADAVVEAADSVMASSSSIQHPVAVRYAWTDDPEGLNFTNAVGLPAAPFRTDDWPLQP